MTNNVSGLGNFGSITNTYIINGKEYNIEEIDTNGDGIISAQEVDTFESTLKTTDETANTEVTAEEMTAEEILVQIEEEYRKLLVEIETELKSEGYPNAMAYVKPALDRAAQLFIGQTTNPNKDTLTSFINEIKQYYNEIKQDKIDLTPEGKTVKNNAIKSEVLDEILAEFVEEDPEFIKTLGKKLEAVANNYINKGTKTIEDDYNGSDLKTDLMDFLNNYLKESELDKMENALVKYSNTIEGFGVYCDETDTKKIKNAVKELLMEAINNGIIPNIDGKNIASEAAIIQLLAKYDDAEDLKAKIQEFIAGISENTLLDKIKADYKKEHSYEIDINLGDFDFTTIDGYTENKTESADYESRRQLNPHQAYIDMKEKATKTLNMLKEAYKNEVIELCKKRGIKFESIASIFDTVFDQSVNETVLKEVKETQVGGNHATGWYSWIPGFWGANFNKNSKAEYNVKDLVDALEDVFNKNFASKLNNTAKNSKDFNIENISYTDAAGADSELKNKLNSNTAYVYEGKESGLRGNAKTGVATTKAQEMINNLKDALIRNAKAMCEANNIEFDENAFNNIFNLASKTAINASVIEHNVGDGKGMKDKFEELSGQKLLSKNMSVFNPKVCYNTMVTEFAKLYTEWVNEEK